MRQIKNKRFKLAALVAACAAIAACNTTTFENPVGETASYNNGTADFSHFVSVGDSLTAGYADGALYKSGQENSFPAILARQFTLVDGGNFIQPLVDDNLGGLLFSGVENSDFGNRLVLNTEPKEPPNNLDPKGPEPIAGTPTTEVTNNPGGVLYNNVGVPGAKSFHLGSPGYGDPAGLDVDPKTANPYFVRFASSATTTIITDAAVQQPSFFTMWIGNNDVLSYATAGGDGVDQKDNLEPATYGSDDITSPTVFSSTYAALVGAMTGANSETKGILLNIPNISTLPYFTAVPYDAVLLEDQAIVDALNDSYTTYNANIASLLSNKPDEIAKRTISFSLGQNPIVIMDEELTDLTDTSDALVNMRQATSEDLIVLTVGGILGDETTPGDPRTALGVSLPLEDKYVLLPSEALEVNTARLAFNDTIKTTADADDDLLFVDVEAIMDELSTTGIDYGTGSIDAVYAKGGAFSLDGVHLTARGYAVIANRIIAKINTGFSANVPPVNPGDYTTIFLK